MKTFDSWFKDQDHSDPYMLISNAWSTCAHEYDKHLLAKETENNRLKKELHDMAGKIQSAQLRADIAMKDIDFLTNEIMRMDGRGAPITTHKLLEIRQRHKLDEVKNG